jgi:HK97 family phage portal protein
LKFLNRIKRFFNLSLTDEKAWDRSLWRPYGAFSMSGEVVTEETALHMSAFWNGVALIARTIASLPLHLMQAENKNNRIFRDLPLYYVMHTQWNPFMTAMVGRECMMAHILTHGNGYAEKVFNGYGDLIELWPIPPTRVLRIEIRENNNLWYEIKVDNDNKWMPREKILHVPGLGFDGFVGYSVVAMARKSLGLGMAMETFASKYFGEGTHPTGIITHKYAMKDPGNLRKALQDSYAGLGKSHKLMLLEEGMDYKSLALNAEDAQFLQSRAFQIPEVARWLNLPPHKLKDLTKSSFNNIEAENTSFVIDSLLPWLICHEQNYNVQLLNKNQHRKQNLYFKHIVEGL